MSYRHKLRQLAVLLATSHGVLPVTLVLVGVERVNDEERISGGFADIFFGKLGGQAVAIKRLHVFRMTSEAARPELKKVKYSLFLYASFLLKCILVILSRVPALEGSDS